MTEYNFGDRIRAHIAAKQARTRRALGFAPADDTQPPGLPRVNAGAGLETTPQRTLDFDCNLRQLLGR